MTEVAELDNECFRTTDGEIAIANLNSARLRSWSRFYQDPQRPGIAETVLENEQLTAQFAGDFVSARSPGVACRNNSPSWMRHRRAWRSSRPKSLRCCIAFQTQGIISHKQALAERHPRM